LSTNIEQLKEQINVLQRQVVVLKKLLCAQKQNAAVCGQN